MPEIELLACFATLGGPDAPGTTFCSARDIRERAEAAARAGYRGIGLSHPDLRVALARHGFSGLRAILAANGLHHIELEAVLDWFADGSRREDSNLIRHELLDAAERLGARHIKVAGELVVTGRVSVERMRWEFAKLAGEARDAGTMAVLEPIAFSNIPDLATAIEIVGDSVDRGGGLMLDSWHVARGAMPLAAIAALPPGMLCFVELNDGSATAHGHPLEETLRERLLCGDGAFDLPGLITASRAAGYHGPWGVEIYSDAQRARPLDDAARQSFQAARRQFTLETIA